jgi:16S rRNA (guanine(1405)-N(7))-methyltransferase
MADRRGRDEIERIVADVRASPKYRRVCARTVQRIAEEEWAKRRNRKQAIKATRSRLHQAYGAYESRVDYDRAYRSLEAAHAEGTGPAIQEACRRLMSRHASTRERLPILERFYAAIYAHTGAPRALLDLACGLNPLSLPWVGLDAGVSYYAYDIDADRVAFLNRYLALAGAQGHARLQDVICDPPVERADVALLLKSSACLERQRKGSTLATLDALDVSHVVVTYPVKSLGRREVGMVGHYARTFLDMLGDRSWPVTRLEFATELVFIVDKG